MRNLQLGQMLRLHPQAQVRIRAEKHLEHCIAKRNDW